uniref:JAB domain-containing protein n=1 Tax=Cyanothece sp. BG0011 TaxID=2082950 RepID=UPI000D1F2FB7|nr:JAB domain-containing protein [Cyanothece sp. BG0011]
MLVPELSQQDLDLTEQLLKGMQLIRIPLINHLILGEGNHFSLHRITDLWQRYPQE